LCGFGKIENPLNKIELVIEISVNTHALICSVSNFVGLTQIGQKKSLLLRELREKGSPLLKLTNNYGPLD